jgi:thioredoxin 1
MAGFQYQMFLSETLQQSKVNAGTACIGRHLLVLDTKNGRESCCQKEGSAIIEITDRNFDSEVLKSKLPVLACFKVEWSLSSCATCLLADKLAQEYEGRVKFIKMDIEKSPEVSTRYHVIAVPTILLFKDSQPVKKLLGFQDCISLRSALNGVTAEEVLSSKN